MKIKVCSKCFKDKPLSEFHKEKRVKDGAHSRCKVCCNIGRNERRNEVRALYAKYKKDLKCEYCGERHPACLVHHHRNPDEKELGIGYATGGYTIERIMNEITKCDVLCANCHRKLHYSLKMKETENG